MRRPPRGSDWPATARSDQPPRVPGAVQSLVMFNGQRAQRGESRRRREDALGQVWMHVPLEFGGSQPAGLVPYCVRYSEAPKIVHQTGTASRLALIGRQPVAARRTLRQLGDATRVPKRVRRFQTPSGSEQLGAELRAFDERRPSPKCVSMNRALAVGPVKSTAGRLPSVRDRRRTISPARRHRWDTRPTPAMPSSTRRCDRDRRHPPDRPTESRSGIGSARAPSADPCQDPIRETKRGQQLRQPHPLASGQRTHEVNIFPAHRRGWHSGRS